MRHIRLTQFLGAGGMSMGVAMLLFSGMGLAAEWPDPGSFYPDGHGGYVYFPMGAVSFADKVISWRMGDPAPPLAHRFDPANTLGVPDYDETAESGYLTLGCGGELTLQFEDNALTDVPGPDLYVFELGPAVEPTRLAISQDGKVWEEVGRIAGGRAEVDIAKWAKDGKSFRYVRLTDLKQGCDGDYPGADIDAVGAIGSGLRLTLSGKVLFDFGRHELKPDAARALDALASHFSDGDAIKIEVAGHTDAIGSDAANQQLSEQRARAVADYLIRHFAIKPENIRVTGYGESQPVADNATEEGRRANRRVEIVIRRGAVAELWRTNLGPLAMAVDAEGRVMARYPKDNGRLYAHRQGRVISGYWVENGSSRTCESKKDGSGHWGRMRIVVSKAGDAFEGWWSYCDSERPEGKLNGKRMP